ncbi:Prohibitin-2 [Tupaia chinensis]|uniref:Prohibitin n=1 Tax=Tupaia chinensis TaxID=246437 RepID=L8Y092_TUPCH|nr:Prohibitin-2 [Tupaia chinensis]
MGKVEGGHRAIFFNLIGGVQQDTILAEGLHFRIPWFQYPIIYDIRARPRKISSPTGSKAGSGSTGSSPGPAPPLRTGVSSCYRLPPLPP